MRRNMYWWPLAAAALMAGWTVSQARALDIVWDGGEGFWDDIHWNGGFTPQELGGQLNGSNGYASPNGGDAFIISGEGSHVTYDANFLQSDFRIKQGSSLRVEDGATWIQPTEPSWSENRWTEYDGDNLILDNGSFIRSGSVPGEGGGAMIFGSWMGDDNFNNPLSPIMHQVTNIEIINGGSFENEGQLWFGSWGDQAPGLIVNMTINDGTLDLTGGNINATDDAAWDGDLAFTFDRDGQGVPKEESYSISFTGPGTITLDNGIVVATKDELGEWTGGPSQSYEDLWDLGILQANGQSGVDGADFAQFFTVTGSSGMDDYTLTSLVSNMVGIPGDYSGNGLVEQADLDLVLSNWGADGTPGGWVNDPPSGFIDQAELDKVLTNWGSMGAAGLAAAGAVPEPQTCILLLVAGLLAWALRR